MPADRAVQLLKKGRVTLLSYRWLDAHHPDMGFYLDEDEKKAEAGAHAPSRNVEPRRYEDAPGFHMKALRSFFVDGKRPLHSAWRQHKYAGIFWECASARLKSAAHASVESAILMRVTPSLAVSAACRRKTRVGTVQNTRAFSLKKL